jgi:hypothetical protein
MHSAEPAVGSQIAKLEEFVARLSPWQAVRDPSSQVCLPRTQKIDGPPSARMPYFLRPLMNEQMVSTSPNPRAPYSGMHKTSCTT